MSHEGFIDNNAEQHRATPEQLLAGLVELRALSHRLDDMDYDSDVLGCDRDFRTLDGGELAIAGLYDLDGHRQHDRGQWYSWKLAIKLRRPHVVSTHGEITPPGRRVRHQFRIDSDMYGGPTQVFQEGSDIPLSPPAVEGLLTTVANSVPLGETAYRIWQDDTWTAI